jgi:TspO/MBR family
MKNRSASTEFPVPVSTQLPFHQITFRNMTWIEWYNSLSKPSWTPPPATIGLIWQILYPVIFISFGFVFLQAFRGKVGSWVALPFAINLVANLIFTPIQFGLRNLPLAAIEPKVPAKRLGQSLYSFLASKAQCKPRRIMFCLGNSYLAKVKSTKNCALTH